MRCFLVQTKPLYGKAGLSTRLRRRCAPARMLVQCRLVDMRIGIANPFGGGVWFKERTGSTMDDAVALVVRGEVSGSIAWAGVQDQGRGRFSDRKWVTTPGEALLFTLAIIEESAAGSFPLSLRVALGLARYTESLGLHSEIKWPNDVLIGEKKVSGILVIGIGNWKYIGIGLNLRQTQFDQQNLRRPATSLLLEGIETEARETLEAFLPFLHSAIHDNAWVSKPEIEKRLWRRGLETEVVEQPGKDPKHGIVEGVDTDGALLLRTPSGIIRCVSGE